jgi:hypothetical protein
MFLFRSLLRVLSDAGGLRIKDKKCKTIIMNTLYPPIMRGLIRKTVQYLPNEK